jgi:hypothetical protein
VIMEKLYYQTHEVQRHTSAIKETVQRACHSVFAEGKMSFRVKDGPWFLPGPAEHVTITVFQKAGCCRRNLVCSIEIDRPKTKEGLHDYWRAKATLFAPGEHAGSTRLLGHLQRQCPFLPKIEVTMTYELASP